MLATLLAALATAALCCVNAQNLTTAYLGQASLFIEPVVGAANVSNIGTSALTIATVTNGTLTGPLVNATVTSGVISFSVTNTSSGISVDQNNQLSWMSSDGFVFSSIGQGTGTNVANVQRLQFTAQGKYAYLANNFVVCESPATTQSSNPSVAECYVIGGL